MTTRGFWHWVWLALALGGVILLVSRAVEAVSPILARKAGGGNRGDRSAGFRGASFLSRTNDGTFTPANNEDWSVCFWVLFDKLAADEYYGLVGCRGLTEGVAADNWFAQRHGAAGDEGINFVYSDGGAYRTLLVEHSFSVGRWYMFAGSIENDVTPVLSTEIWDTAAIANTATTGGTGFINTGVNAPLSIGSWQFAGAHRLQGRIDKVGMWNREFTAGETLALHNGGRGLRLDQLTAGLRSGLVAWYDQDERSGASLWRDGLLTYPLSASGVVLSTPRAGDP